MWIQGGLAEEAPLRLLQAEMHPGKKGTIDERNLVEHQGHASAPLSFQLTERLALELVLPRGIGERVEARTRGPRAEADIECGDTSVSGQLHGRIDTRLLEAESDVLNDRLQGSALAAASRAAEPRPQGGHDERRARVSHSPVGPIEVIGSLESAVSEKPLRGVQPI